MKTQRAVLLAALMVSVSLAGCFGEAEVEDEVVDLGDHVLGVVVGIREEGLHVFASRNAR